jgi:hypothetical protein
VRAGQGVGPGGRQLRRLRRRGAVVVHQVLQLVRQCRHFQKQLRVCLLGDALQDKGRRQTQSGCNAAVHGGTWTGAWCGLATRCAEGVSNRNPRHVTSRCVHTMPLGAGPPSDASRRLGHVITLRIDHPALKVTTYPSSHFTPPAPRACQSAGWRWRPEGCSTGCSAAAGERRQPGECQNARARGPGALTLSGDAHLGV